MSRAARARRAVGGASRRPGRTAPHRLGWQPGASRRPVLALVLVVAALALAGCSVTVPGQPISAGGLRPDGPSGLRTDAPESPLRAEGKEQGNRFDELALDTMDDQYTYYAQIFGKDFGKEFSPAKGLLSYDSRSATGSACGQKLNGLVNAMYLPRCDTIGWDRGVLMPSMQEQVGELSAPTILAHETGHLVQSRLGATRSSVLLLEQQADCYAGAYWGWVSKGNSKYFQLSGDGGMRQILGAMLQVGDPVGLSASNDKAHGTAFDRAFAASLGFASGAARCNQITQAEVDKRVQASGFASDKLPQKYANMPITPELLGEVAGTLDEYFGKTVPDYRKPKLEQFQGGKPPSCPDSSNNDSPVLYCPATNTVSYDLAQLQEIGKAPESWQDNVGDFSAIILLASRYGLAAQASGGGTAAGDNAGLRGLCYAGTWASWMRQPQGEKGLRLSPNDLNKAIYQVVHSPMAAYDDSGKTGTSVLNQVQAFNIGVLYDIRQCFDYYSPGASTPTGLPNPATTPGG
ncbi:neutral zinc metallopeptidase [Nakamurella aerolata]|uniref:Metalloprotease n=1 Tax=Nakamurella aerolata TaxID=1656892 RepID=A0A849A6B4_9ACTN|nr:neutral zinc metallopeptidase [Nakamurella aerolata]NNG34963.1 hypothetical protein [Nakamurella aerolata]